jgi:putative ABC transport system permease protein
MSTLFQDLKFGFRMMAKTPVVTGVAVLSLALGIAANASMFSILNSFLFEPLPYEDQDELVLFQELRDGDPIEMSPGTSIANFRDYAEAAQSIESATAYTIELANLTGLDIPEQLRVVVGTPNLFEVFGAQPFIGRSFQPGEGIEGAGQVLILEYDYWQTRFLGERDVLGRTVMLDGAAHTIIGVMPEAFDMIPANVHAFRPSDFQDQLESRAARGYIGFGRLRDGATAEQANLEVAGTAQRLAAEFPDSNRGWGVQILPLGKWFPGPTDTQLLKILTAVTLFGLLIACANVANLLLARAEVRQKEVAVRTALGVGRGRVLRQLLTESTVMGTTAGVIGTAMSVWVIQWLRAAMPPELPSAMLPELDPEVLGLTMLVSILTGIAFGLAPALHAVGGNLRESLGSGGRGGSVGRSRKRLRNAFVVGEIAVALALLSGSGFLIQAFERLTNDDPGFDASGLLTFQIAVLDDRYPEDDDLMRFERELIQTLEAVPGIKGVAVMSSLPRGRNNPQTTYTVDGRPIPDPTEQPRAALQVVNEKYFETMEIPLRDGRLIEESDRADAAWIAVVSEGFVAREFPDEDPLGKQITIGDESRQIVGVVADILQDRVALAGRDGEMIYLPITQFALRNPSFAVRSAGDPADLSTAVRQAVWSLEPDQPIGQLRTLQAHIDESLAGPRAISLFLMVMGGIALSLAAMGIYGVMAHSVMQQQREIGIRMALGARQSTVVSMITKGGLALVGMGLVLGLPLAYLMFRGTLSMLNLFSTEVGFAYPLALSGALLVTAVLATLLPARRASRITPLAALKE